MTKKERLSKYLEYKGIKPTAFAKAIGVSNSHVSEIDQRKNNSTLFLAIKSAPAFFDCNTDWIATGQGEMLHPALPHGQEKFRRYAEAVSEQSQVREGPDLCDEQRRLLDAWNAADPVSRKNAMMILEQSAKESRAKGTGGSDCAGQKSA